MAARLISAHARRGQRVKSKWNPDSFMYMYVNVKCIVTWIHPQALPGKLGKGPGHTCKNSHMCCISSPCLKMGTRLLDLFYASTFINLECTYA